MEITFKIPRRDAKSNGKPEVQSYTIEAEPTTSVFEALARIREEQDGSLAFRGNCFRGFCGDCVMRANGRLTLMCLTPISRVVKDGEITVVPAPYAPVTKDLMVDSQTFLWDKYKSVNPWLQADGGVPEPVTEEGMAAVRKAMRCTMCGLCDYGCTVIDVDTHFLGPAALTKAWRFVVDPRDTATVQRLKDAGEPRGMWDCVHCWEASEHCPYGIDPTHRIMEMRDFAVARGAKSGSKNPQVARHYDGMANSVRESGWLDERRLGLETVGVLGSLKYAGTAVKLLRRGKMTIKPHEKRPGADQIRAIMERAEQDMAVKGKPREEKA